MRGKSQMPRNSIINNFKIIKYSLVQVYSLKKNPFQKHGYLLIIRTHLSYRIFRRNLAQFSWTELSIICLWIFQFKLLLRSWQSSHRTLILIQEIWVGLRSHDQQESNDFNNLILQNFISEPTEDIRKKMVSSLFPGLKLGSDCINQNPVSL